MKFDGKSILGNIYASICVFWGLSTLESFFTDIKLEIPVKLKKNSNLSMKNKKYNKLKIRKNFLWRI